MNKVYITKTSSFLPNNPIKNDEIEQYLGLVGQLPSKAKNLVLRNNKIKTRYYAIDKSGNSTHTNAEMTFEAIKKLLGENPKQSLNIELLSCGTTISDQLIPSHASMVHGLLPLKDLEINSAAGVCCSGISALKYAYLSLLAGNAKKAIATGSEKSSLLMQGNKFNYEIRKLKEHSENPMLSFNKDFIRFMLSDGAGAFLLEIEPQSALALEILWIDFYSFANELPVCMYSGIDKQDDGKIVYWQDCEPMYWIENSIFNVKQDIRILDQFILAKGVEALKKIIKKRNFDISQIDYFLVHLSSYYFYEKLNQLLR